MNAVQVIEARSGLDFDAEPLHRRGILQIARYTLGLLLS